MPILYTFALGQAHGPALVLSEDFAMRLVLLLPVLVLFVVSCVTNESGRQTLNLVSDSHMNALGQEAYEDITQQEKAMPDGKLRLEVLALSRQVAAASGADLDWDFRIFDSDTVNAFCLPGGKIGIYRGIIPVARTNAALAAIIGHEIAHATLRHGSERVSHGLLVELGLKASDLALSDARMRVPLLAALGLGAQVGVLLPFSRLQESEADRLGLLYMMRAGFDGSEASALWQRMAAHSAKTASNKPPAWLSTHPDDDARQASLARLASEWQGRYPVTTATQELEAPSPKKLR